jgi:hypothetical protein
MYFWPPEGLGLGLIASEDGYMIFVIVSIFFLIDKWCGQEFSRENSCAMIEEVQCSVTIFCCLAPVAVSTCMGNYSRCTIKRTENEFRIIQEPRGGSIQHRKVRKHPTKTHKHISVRVMTRPRHRFTHISFRSMNIDSPFNKQCTSCIRRGHYTRSRRNYRDLR